MNWFIIIDLISADLPLRASNKYVLLNFLVSGSGARSLINLCLSKDLVSHNNTEPNLLGSINFIFFLLEVKISKCVCLNFFSFDVKFSIAILPDIPR